MAWNQTEILASTNQIANSDRRQSSFSPFSRIKTMSGLKPKEDDYDNVELLMARRLGWHSANEDFVHNTQSRDWIQALVACQPLFGQINRHFSARKQWFVGDFFRNWSRKLVSYFWISRGKSALANPLLTAELNYPKMGGSLIQPIAVQNRCYGKSEFLAWVICCLWWIVT